MAVEVNHNIELSGLSDFSTKLEDMARSIQESFSQFAHTLNTAPDRMQQQTINNGGGEKANVNKLLDSDKLIKSNEKLTDVITRLAAIIHTTGEVNGRNNDEQKRKEQNERSAKITAAAIGTVVGATLLKLGNQYENLGGTIGQQFQSINQTAGSSKQFLQSQYNAQTSAKTEMAKSVVSGSATSLGIAAGSIFGLPGMAIGGIVGHLIGNYANADLNKDLGRKQAAYTYGLNNADTAFRLNMMSSRFGAQGTATGKQFTLPGIEGASGTILGGGTYRMTPLQQQLQNSPFANNAEQIIGGLRGNVSGMNLAKTVNQIGVSAMANNIPESQLGQFAGLAQTIAKYSNKDLKEVLEKSTEYQIKYGGDTVQNLTTIQKLLQTTGVNNVDKLFSDVYRNQQNPMSIQAMTNWESKDPIDKYKLQLMGEMFGADADTILKNGLNPAQIKRVEGWDDKSRKFLPKDTAFASWVGMVAKEGGVSFGQLVKGFKPLPTESGVISNLTERPLSEVTPPSTQEWMKSVQDALSNITVPIMNVSANTINMNDTGTMRNTFVGSAAVPSAPKNIKNHNGTGITGKSKTTLMNDFSSIFHTVKHKTHSSGAR